MSRLHDEIFNEVVEYITSIQENLPQIRQDLMLVAMAAESGLQWSPPAVDKLAIEQAIQNILKLLVFSAEKRTLVRIPRDFWELTSLGQALMAAMVCVNREELITQTEAAKLCEKSLAAINQSVRDGRLMAYIDRLANNPQQGRILVSRSEVMSLYGKSRG